MKKIVISLIACMILLSILPSIIGENGAGECTFTERTFIEQRKVIPVYTAQGLERGPAARGKPGVYVVITNPGEGDTVSGSVTIAINSNDNPSIKIDGTVVGTGLSYTWITTNYADGVHTIVASAKGNTDTVVVTVDNNGGGNTPPDVTITTPSNGATVSDTVILTVAATDIEDGTLIANIYIDGSFITTANSYSWDTMSYSDGGHTLYAEATDSGGLTGSDSITVTSSKPLSLG